MSSNTALSKVKRLLGQKKAGFSGTLDPLATGVLPIAMGEALKTMHYMTFSTKEYRFEVTFGERRDTGDLEGDVIETSAHYPSEKDILSVLPQFLGGIEQIPPIYSAIKIEGKRACDRVRDGEEVVLKSRKVFLSSLKLERVSDKQVTFVVVCSAGTYVRSLAEDIAKALGTLGYVGQLRRVAVGQFCEEMTITLENLESLVHNAPDSLPIKPIGIGLDDILAIPVTLEDYQNLIMGKYVRCEGESRDVVQLRLDGNWVGFASLEDSLLKPKRMMKFT